MRNLSPAKHLAAFLAKYDAPVATIARGALARMRKRLPGMFELVYDNYNALAIGFSPSEKPSQAVFSIALYPRWVSLFFLNGARLADPAGLLKGNGKKVRHIVLTGAADIQKPEVEALLSSALEIAGVRVGPLRRGVLVIRSVSARQRPRRPTSA